MNETISRVLDFLTLFSGFKLRLVTYSLFVLFLRSLEYFQINRVKFLTDNQMHHWIMSEVIDRNGHIRFDKAVDKRRPNAVLFDSPLTDNEFQFLVWGTNYRLK